ncbi:hypothetical protein J437_LFUL017561 [Ladona fulva]|uniref:Major facilitator superfamily (MFS) profile domain-containing protein n=1 Tax=Ladona fulva TaxID=123851 RepID=A0A8K0P922_LADFU|nr:hypothetical protein J437_LFUL017561 [Ladona fulva]
MENGQVHSNQDSGELEMVNGTSKTDVVMSSAGEFGRWQALVAFLVSLIKIPVAWFQLGIVFLAPPLTSPPICSRPDGVNLTLEQWKNISQPPIVKWDLICDRTQLTNIVQMTFMFGILIGNILFGIWADRIGRKRPLFFAIIFQSIAAIAAAVVPWYEGFVILRFLLAICTGGTMITSFVICMEIVGGWWRTAIPILYQVPFGLGQIIMSVLAFYIREWRHLQITLALASSLLVGCWWVVPESPRWLLAVGRRKKAYEILKKAAKRNGRSTKALNDLIREDDLQNREQVTM